MNKLDNLDIRAPNGAFSTFDSAVLVPEVERLKPDQVYLEVGVDKGKSLWIARQSAQAGVEVYGVDLRKDPQVLGTTFYQGDSVKIAKIWGNEIPGDERWRGKEINVLFIDGDHTYEGCSADLKAWYPYMARDGVILLHDCDASSPGVVQAYNEFIKQHKVKDAWLHPETRCSMARIRL